MLLYRIDVFDNTRHEKQEMPLDNTTYILYLYRMTGKQVLELLKKHGWSLDRIAGSHHIMVKEGFPTISVPVHGSKDLKPGTLHAIMKAGGIK